MIFDRDLLSYERRKDEHRIEIFVEPLFVANRIVIIIVSAAMIKMRNPFNFFTHWNVFNNLYFCRDSQGGNSEVLASWSLVFE